MNICATFIHDLLTLKEREASNREMRILQRRAVYLVSIFGKHVMTKVFAKVKTD